MRKHQTQLLVSQHTRERIAILAAVRGESRAEVARIALEGAGLSAMESMHVDRIGRLTSLAKRRGTEPATLAEDLLDRRMTVEDAERLEGTPA